MEVRTGYRQSNVGVIPEDWEVKLVEEIADVKSGKRLPLGHSLTDNETQHPYIRVIDMFQGGVILNDIKYVPDDVYPAIKNYRIFKDDIFISVAGTLGIVGKIPIQLDGANLTENADRLTNIQCNRDFLLYVFMSSLVQNTIDSERTLGAQPKLALTRIKRFQVSLPSTKAEQIAIATALSDVDALISNLEKLISKKRNIKQGAMQLLLTGKKRLPGFSEKWEEKKAKEFGEVITGSTPSTSIEDYWNGDIPWATPTDIKNKRDIYQTERQITTLGMNVIRKLSRNSLLVTCIASIGKNAILRMDGGCNQQINAIIPNKEHNIEYLYYLFEGNKQYLLGHAGTTATNIVSKRDFSEIVFSVPSLPEQTAIAKVLSDIDEELEALERKLVKYRLIKQGMMQELLTGKTRLM